MMYYSTQSTTSKLTSVVLHAFYLSVLQKVFSEKKNTFEKLKSHLDVAVWLEMGLNGQAKLYLRQSRDSWGLK